MTLHPEQGADSEEKPAATRVAAEEDGWRG